MNKLPLASLLLAITVPLARAQTPAAPPATTEAAPIAYDVMTIKLNKSGSGSMGIDVRNGNYIAHNLSLKILLQGIYNIKEDLISGVPGAIDAARFDVDAKVVDSDPDAIKKMTPEQRRVMLLPLLAERFKLKTHTETKVLPIYELVVAKDGPKFRPSEDQSKHGSGGTSAYNNEKLVSHDLPIESFAKALAGQVHRTVIDKTGLAGNYDITVVWSPDDSPTLQADTAPSIFTALREQLGLKLQPAKGPVETLVVDHVEMPTEN